MDTRYIKCLIPTSNSQKVAVAISVGTALISSVAIGAAFGACYIGYKWSAAQTVSPASKERAGLPKIKKLEAASVIGSDAAVYHPDIPKPTTADFQKFSAQISNSCSSRTLRAFRRLLLGGDVSISSAEKSEIIGLNYVQEKSSNRWVPVAIARTERGNIVHFFVHNLENNQMLGKATVHPISYYTNKDGKQKYGNPNYIFFSENMRECSKDQETIYLKDINTKRHGNADAYKYVGYLLIKAIQQGYKETFQGRLFMDAAWNSHGFYYRLGARANDKQTNQKIEARLSASADTSDLMCVWMSLSESASAQWIEEIDRNPILLPEELG